MEPSSFDESNGIADTPAGLKPETVEPLAVYRGLQPTIGMAPQPIIISCWKPTQAELDEIARTGRVWVGMMGHRMPPTWVSGDSPFEGLEEAADES